MTSQVTDYVTRKDLIRWAQELVRYPSPQTDKFESDPALLGLIEEWVIPLLRQLEIPYRKDSMGNVIVELGPTGSSERIILMSYAMTHPASNMSNPYEGELIKTEKGEGIRGRGISEQKGALVAALSATYAAMSEGKLNGQLVFTVSTAGETGRHDAAESILESLERMPRLGIIVIGTSNRVSLGNKGRLDVIINIKGKASHSSMPWLGIDAIHCAKEVISRLEELNLGPMRHPELGEATLTPTAIRSFPEATHTVQSDVHLVYDRRLLPGQDPNEALEQIQDALKNFDPCQVEVLKGAFMYPNEIKKKDKLVKTILAGHKSIGLNPPEFFYSHGCLDAGYLNQKGCASTMWGPGSMTEWHSDNEMIIVDDLISGANAYFGFIKAALAGR